jgi:branched-subunit amino acid permease
MTGGGSINQLSLDFEAMLVITPVHHFGITIGPIAAIPLTGKVSNTVTVNGLNTSTTTSNDISMWYVALTLGVLGYF